MNTSKTKVIMKGQIVGWQEIAYTNKDGEWAVYVKLWDREGRLIHNNSDIDDSFISNFFMNQLAK